MFESKSDVRLVDSRKAKQIKWQRLSSIEGTNVCQSFNRYDKHSIRFDVTKIMFKRIIKLALHPDASESFVLYLCFGFIDRHRLPAGLCRACHHTHTVDSDSTGRNKMLCRRKKTNSPPASISMFVFKLLGRTANIMSFDLPVERYRLPCQFILKSA